MTRVDLAAAAVEDLERLVVTHSLPGDTRSRVRDSLRLLETFPRLGPQLTGRWQLFRFLLGPWRWLLIVYIYLEAEDQVVVVSIQDARAALGATAQRGPR